MPRPSLQRVFLGFYLLITALLLISPALYNRYPLMYFDSGAYMEMAVNFEPSFHRAIGYPLLMKLTGLLISNWPVIVLQGLLISFLLFRLLRSFFATERVYWYHFATVVLLTFTSSLSWYAAQLMPDVWTFILILTVALLIFERELSRLGAALYGMLLFLALLTHLSHIPLLILLLISFLFAFLLSQRKTFDLGAQTWTALTLPLVLAVLFTCSFNYVHDKGFRLSLASNAFITANLGEMGVLKLYLDENCPNTSPALCAMKDKLPLETYGYLWDPEGPVQKHPQGWAGANEEFAPVVHDFFTQPRYLKWFAFSSVKSTFQQMFQIELGSGLQYSYDEGSPPYWPMKEHFKQELNEYLTSVQNKGDELPLKFFKWMQYLSIMLSLLIIGRTVLMRQLSKELALLLFLFFLAYFFNAAITGVLANVYERLQCRLLPELQLFAILVYFATVDQRQHATEE